MRRLGQAHSAKRLLTELHVHPRKWIRARPSTLLIRTYARVHRAQLNIAEPFSIGRRARRLSPLGHD